MNAPSTHIATDFSLQGFIRILKQGGVIAFPTETVYGLGADAWNADAVSRIFSLKGRPPDNPLIVHVSSYEMLESLTIEISGDALKLMDHFWPGPLAMIFPKHTEVLDIVTAGLSTVAVRMPDHPIPLRLITEAGPLAAPSANTSGRPSPTRAEHVIQDFGSEIPVIDGGHCYIGLESTVIDLSEKPYTILRPGHITQKQLEEVLSQPVRISWAERNSEPESIPRSPGMKYTHYAPDARVRWLKPGEWQDSNRKDPRICYLLHHKTTPHTAPYPSDMVIHYHGNYQEMARDLYDRFRMADLNACTQIAIEPFNKEDVDTQALLNRILKAIGE